MLNLNNLQQEQVISTQELMSLLRMGRTMVYNKASKDSKYYDEDFPKPICVSANKNVYNVQDVLKYIEVLKQRPRTARQKKLAQ